MYIFDRVESPMGFGVMFSHSIKSLRRALDIVRYADPSLRKGRNTCIYHLRNKK